MSCWSSVPSRLILLAALLISGTQLLAQAPDSRSGWSATPQEGLRFHGAEGFPELHFGALLAADYVFFDDRNVRDSDPRLDRALLRADGRFNSEFSFHVDVDLNGIDTRGGFDSAWISYQPNAAFRITAGLIEVPLSFEYSIPEEDLPFVGYAFPAFLTGRTDLGLSIEGEGAEGLVSFEVVAVAGEGFDLQGQRLGEPQFSARLMTYPLRSLDNLARGIFFQGAYAYSPDYSGHLDVNTPLRSRVFNVPRLQADAAQHLAFVSGIDAGPVRIFHEFTRSSLIDLETSMGDESLHNQIKSWQANLNIMLTGESYDSRSFRMRDRPVLGGGDYGSVELAVRYSNADIDRRFFDLGIANFAASSQEFRTFSGAINWYLDANFRFTAEVTRTLADDDPAEFGDGGRDTSFVLRAQWRF